MNSLKLVLLLVMFPPMVEAQDFELSAKPEATLTQNVAPPVVMEGRKVSLRSALKQAMRQSTLKPIDKLRLRLAMLRPEGRAAVESFLAEKAAELEPTMFGSRDEIERVGIDLDNLERFLQILIEYLPQILEIIMQLFADNASTLPPVFAYVDPVPTFSIAA